MEFGERIKQIREDRGVSRKELAEELGIPYTTLRNYEMGTREPGHKTLVELAKIFNVSCDYLLGIEYHGKGLTPLQEQLLQLTDKMPERKMRALILLIEANNDDEEETK